MEEIITKCPFIAVFPDENDCVYMQEGEGLCQDLHINIGNSDAWCHEMIITAIGCIGSQ